MTAAVVAVALVAPTASGQMAVRTRTLHQAAAAAARMVALLAVLLPVPGQRAETTGWAQALDLAAAALGRMAAAAAVARER